MEIIINTADSTAIYEKALSIGLFYISPSLNYTKYSFCINFSFGIILPLFYGIIKKNSIVMRYII